MLSQAITDGISSSLKRCVERSRVGWRYLSEHSLHTFDGGFVVDRNRKVVDGVAWTREAD